MTIRHITTFIFLVLSFSGYAEDKIEKYEKFDGWLYEAFQNGTLKKSSDIKNISKLKKKISENISVGHSIHKLKAVSYYFSGLYIHAIVEQTKEAKAYISKIKITDKKWPLANGIKVGDSISVLSIFDPVLKSEVNKYCGVNNCLIVTQSNGVISSLTITLYID